MRQRDGHTRRQILKAVVGSTGIVLADPLGRMAMVSAQSAPAPAGTLRLSDDLFVVTIPGEANVVAHTTAAGVVLVDGVSTGASQALLAAVTALPGVKAIRTVFNTHWHPEQTGANEALVKAGATIIAHENTRLWLTTDITYPWNGRRFLRASKIAQPTKTFYTTGALDSGVRYGYIPDAAHTDGDLYVYFPQQNVLAVGDAVSGQGWPVVDWATGGWIGGIVGGFQRLGAVGNADTRIVPARGPVLSMADLAGQAKMYGTIYDRLTGLLNKGRGPDEAVAARPTKEFDAQMGNPDEFVRRAFESLWAYLSPDA